jgi:hypothetical protein
MAAGISLIELPCTAGFPVVWSGIAVSHALFWGYFALLVLLLQPTLGVKLGDDR